MPASCLWTLCSNRALTIHAVAVKRFVSYSAPAKGDVIRHLRHKKVVICGPSNWAKRFPKAAGEKQSPIDILCSEVQQDPFLTENPLRWTYNGLRCTSLLNTGSGWRVDVSSPGPRNQRPISPLRLNLRGGPLHHNYQMVQFHSHWGTCSETGSEHTIDGEHYAGELHLVHYNVDMYSRASEAACSDKGLTVLAVFFKEGKQHEELKKITDCMSKVIYKGMKCPLDQDIDINSLIPANGSYWTYEGSLTTPPCYESVTWIVFKEPIEVSREQFEAFRQLLSYKEGGGPQVPTDGPILKNFRPPQPLNGRVVREPSE
ncbi:carbonic anhydrase 1-like isoform X1 [Dermacentor variabilis]|uniref:carbonic anhydrase 1-like isoform X1 n=1 Tax=Dermacentor variabilis TaxID=34621 RepID=UPI003F5B4E7D